jgi:hypothetical protein
MMDMLEGRHKDLGPVLLVEFVESRRVVVITVDGSLHVAEIGDVSANWHFDENTGRFVPDFAENP